MRRILAILCVPFLSITAAHAVPSIVEAVMPGVYVVRDDTGNWPGDNAGNGIAHMVAPQYQAKKVLDMSDLPEAQWQQTQQVRLSACFCVRDYSWHDLAKPNGLDESYEVVVNGKVHTYPTNGGAPVMREDRGLDCEWYDFVLPKEEFVRGPNEIIFRKAPTINKPAPDDYLYLGIDNSQKRGNSSVTFDGKNWTQAQLTVPGGNGEYMVRLYLLTRDTHATVEWHPGSATPLRDEADLILYSGARGAKATGEGLPLPDGAQARLEWDPARLDSLVPVKVSTEAAGQIVLQWLDPDGKPVDAAKGTGAVSVELPVPRSLKPSGLVITANGAGVVLKGVTLDLGLSYHPLPARIDMCPQIAKPVGKPADRTPSCDVSTSARPPAGTIINLRNSSLSCRFSIDSGHHLRLTSLYDELSASQIVRDPYKVPILLIESGGKRYAGSSDFELQSIRKCPGGFVAALALRDPAMRAELRATIADDGLHIGLTVTNGGLKPLDFKVAFPCLSGLAVSDKPEDDSYFFPWGGGIISSAPTVIRRGYGDHAAIYQMMDLFSPARGAGLSIRADDRDGRYKVLALRKSIPGKPELGGDQATTPTTAEYKWTNPLEAVPGTGVAYEYLRRTRAPGESFSPADAVITAHTGDWHVAMKAYADWAHRAWKFRPYPSRLAPVLNMIATGWGQDILFRDGKYRTDFLTPGTDCIELMSWWDWSPVGPWGTPIDKIREVMGEAAWKSWEPYIVKDPVTGKMMWNNQPGDYDGYNAQFGGLPAFRKAVQACKDRGVLTTLYTDPIRMDGNSKIGKAHGKEWDVVLPDGSFAKGYDVWNPCHDVAEYRQWVADTMKRVMRETGADGIRLDEYGHGGWACFSKLHKHTFAEPGCQEWLRGIAETTKLVRAAMDEVDPKTVLTTEHPGYDFLMQFIDGCITYDLDVQGTPLRPLECNIQRFYFPECKAYELDYMGRDPLHRKRFWNAVASFGAYYPPAMDRILRQNADVFASRDCDPLIQGAAAQVYVNRFGSGPKTIFTLYNATGHTFDGAALRVPLKAGEHLFDLLNCAPCETEKRADGIYLKTYLPRDQVICVARLPQALAISRRGASVDVAAKRDGGDRAVVCSAAGDELASAPIREGRCVIDLSKLTADAKPACVKLMHGAMMVDVVGW
jgi:hypothetical protein